MTEFAASRGHAFLRRLVLGALAGGLFGCGQGEGDPQADSVISAPPVMVVGVVLHDFVDRIEATGQLIAKDRASISAQVGGQVTAIAFEEGEAVARGQAVIEIDPERRDLERQNAAARVAESRASLAEAQREMKRVEQLRTHASASESQYDVATTQLALAGSRLAAAQAQLGLAERAMRDSSIGVPFSGLIARRYVSEGEFVTVGQKLFDLVDIDPLEVEFDLAEVDSGRVQLGHQVEVRVAPMPDRVFRGSVSIISPVIDATTRTLRVRAVVDNGKGRLRPGLFARIHLGVAHREGVPMVPEDAILQRADGSVVFRMVGSDRVERIPVVTGIHRDGWVEVAEGLAAGDVVVVRGQTGLVQGAKVSVRNQDGSSVGAGVFGLGGGGELTLLSAGEAEAAGGDR